MKFIQLLIYCFYFTLMSGCGQASISGKFCSDDPKCYKLDCLQGNTPGGCKGWVSHCKQKPKDNICPVSLPIVDVNLNISPDMNADVDVMLLCAESTLSVCKDILQFNDWKNQATGTVSRIEYKVQNLDLTKLNEIKFCKGKRTEADLEIILMEDGKKLEHLKIDTHSSFLYPRSSALDLRLVVDDKGNFPCSFNDKKTFNSVLNRLLLR